MNKKQMNLYTIGVLLDWKMEIVKNKQKDDYYIHLLDELIIQYNKRISRKEKKEKKI